MIRLQLTIAMISMIAVSSLATQVQADEYQHLDEMALRIQVKSAELFKEMQHYRHAPQYRHVRQDALELKRLARDFHRIAHHEGNLHKLQAGVNELDYRFHHVEDLVDQMELNALRGFGHVHGRTGHVRALMNDLEDCLHHMQRDLRIICRNMIHTLYRPRRDYVPQGYTRCPETGRLILAPGRGYSTGYDSGIQSSGFNEIRRDGITLGNGIFQVRFNF